MLHRATMEVCAVVEVDWLIERLEWKPGRCTMR
jgi:hypothetical protein